MLVGCGPRAREHANAYRRVSGGRIVAACARTSEHVNRFCRATGIEHAYTDVSEMLEREHPDLVHLVTTADLRVPLMEVVADHKVPVAIIEKPIALQGEDWKRVRDLAARSPTEFVVNTQLPFHPTLREFERAIEQGDIGEVGLIDASAGSTVLDQGVHLLDLAHRFAGLATPRSVFAQSGGTENLWAPEASHDETLIAVDLGDVRANMITGSLAPRIGDGPFYMHKRIAVYGTQGFVRWNMVGWERLTASGGYKREALDYAEQDELGQAALTEAAFALLEPDALIHPTRIALSLIQFNVILGAYVSSLSHTPVALPCDPPDGLLDSLRLASRESPWH